MEKPRYLDFLDPIQIIWRKGTVDDPYIPKVEMLPVINQRIVLDEIPAKDNRVKIPFLKEINHDAYIKFFLNEDEYYVDYSNGIVFFHASKEGETLTLTYKGRGIMLYPSSRIYHHDRDTDTVLTLKEITVNIINRLAELEVAHRDLTGLKDQLQESIRDNDIHSDRLKQLIEQAMVALDLVEDAYNTTQLVYKPYVQTVKDIEATYPFPKVGWCVQVYATGERYRWDGANWIPIDILGGNLPLASELIDGLMSKESYKKLMDISDHVDTRVMYFIVSDLLSTGVQKRPQIDFPFDGEIIGISASLGTVGNTETVIQVEKSSDYITWTNITTPEPVRIAAGSHTSNEILVLSNPKVSAGDVFRLNILATEGAENLTLNIKIKI